MTAEVLEQPQQTEEPTDEQAEAQFSEGFGKAPAKAAPEQDPEKTEPEATAKPDEPEKAAETETPKKDDPAQSALIAGMSESDWNAAVTKSVSPIADELRKELRKAFGQVGEVNRAVQELKAARGNPAAGKKITAELLKRVNEELPGLGAALAEDLSGILGGAEEAQAKAEAKGQTFDPEAYFTQKIAPALEKAEARNNQRAEMRIVKSIHRDFDTVVKTPEFATWLKTLPEDRQKEVRESEDGFVAADAVTEFKAARDKVAKAKEGQQKRLENAVAPKGAGGGSGQQPTDDEAEFSSGFKKADRQYRP